MSVADPLQIQSPDQVQGMVERVTFHSPQTGFAVLQLKVRGQKELVTVVGSLPEVSAGEWLEAGGRWLIDPQYGRQFRADQLRTAAPTSPEGIKKYMGSGLIKGIGPALAGRLVDAFDREVFSIIEKSPQRLKEVEGIGEGRSARIAAAWQDQKKVREIMVFLHSHRVSTSRAFRIYKTYGEQAIARVREDPYRLARDIHGIGFKTADQIAQSLGVEKQSELRARAGVEHVLQELTGCGHCAFPRAPLVERTEVMLEIPRDIVEAAIQHGLTEGRLVEDADVEGGPLIYLSGFRWAERRLADTLVKLSRSQHPCTAADPADLIARIERNMGFALAPAQRSALEEALECKVMVITGGPGVGKTTVVNAIVQALKDQHLDVVLCAPTGRAAKRMSETTGQGAKTIHRLLEFDPTVGGFRRGQELPLQGDAFVVDEMSMVDLMLAYQFVRALPAHASLILVGDVDQLPSVGPGNVLRDIIDSGIFPVCRLTEVFRQAAHSAIVANAHRINHGLLPVYPVGRVDDVHACDFYLFPAEEPQEIVQTVVRLVKESVPQKFGFNGLDDIQTLTPTQRGELGARSLNLLLQHALNHNEEFVERYGWKFRLGDKVMQTVNDYQKEVLNGDIGRVARVDLIEQQLTVHYDERDVIYGFDELDDLQPAYAITIHKSQGSEYPAVVIPIHTQHYMMLQRNLLYTAVTRGRKLVVLVGSRRAIAMAVKRLESIRRITTLKQRLEEADAEAGLSVE